MILCAGGCACAFEERDIRFIANEYPMCRACTEKLLGRFETPRTRRKRLGVAAIITSKGPHAGMLLLGRRGKEPNKGLFVLPGGGVEDDESLEDALEREIYEETGLRIVSSIAHSRWSRPDVIELPDRVILVARAIVMGSDMPRDGSDLYDVRWFDPLETAVHGIADLSAVVHPVLARNALVPWDFPNRGAST